MPYPWRIWEELTQEKRKDVFLEATKEALARKDLSDDLNWVTDDLQPAIDEEIEFILEEVAITWDDNIKADNPRDRAATGTRRGTLNR